MTNEELETRYETDDLSWVVGKADSEFEGSQLERKKTFDHREVARQISAFANGEPPGGIVVVGVDKEGVAFGIERREYESKRDQLFKQVDNSGWRDRAVALSGDRVVVVVRVPSSERVTRLADGSAYRRLGDKSIELTAAEITERTYATGERAFEDEPCVRLSEADLHRDLCTQFQAQLAAQNGQTLANDLELDLRNRTLLRDVRGEPWLTNAGLLVLGTKPTTLLPGAAVRFFRFDGTDELVGAQRNVVKDEQFEGPLPLLLKSFLDFFQGQLRQPDYLGPDGTFIKLDEYPRAAWEEVVVNALVHRSYSLRNATVTVKLFDDRLEVESPGGFPGLVRPDHFRSYPRNRHLAEALKYFQFVRLAQEGTRRIKQELERAGLPPAKFVEGPNADFVRVTLFNDLQRRMSAGGHADAVRWTEIEQSLGDELFVVRRDGLRKWHDSSSVTRAPKPVVARAVALLADPKIKEAEKLEVLRTLDLLSKIENGLLLPLVKQVLDPRSHVEAPYFFGGEFSSLRWLAAKSDDALETVVRWLETAWDQTPLMTAPTEQLRWALSVVEARLMRTPLPSREWITRVLALGRRYGAEGSKLVKLIAG